MTPKTWYIVFVVSCFVSGAVFWKVRHSGYKTSMVAKPVKKWDSGARVLMHVGHAKVTANDLDFEYSLHTSSVFAAEELTPIPDLGSRYERELMTLKERLLSSMVERKMLYQHLQRDPDFDAADPNRFKACLGDWESTVQSDEFQGFDEDDKERLKQRLCEQSIVSQYLDEHIYPRVHVSGEEIAAYYEAHKADFSQPKRVVIRQIVLPSEKEAKKARHRLNRYNFAARAKELSIAPEAKDGGLVGPYARGELPRIFDVAFRMRRGGIHGILKSTYGFHLIMLEKRLPREELSLKQATPKIKKILQHQKQEKEYAQWVELALNSVKVKPPRPLW